MKLQYLGDARDAFKWDMLHWMCTSSSFSKLVFVPLLTPDIKGSNEGLTPHHRFACQDMLRPFLESLKEEPRSLHRISALGTINLEKQFEVCVFAPETATASGNQRNAYWSGFDAHEFENAIVFFDPDNGFETKTQSGSKWVRHDELRRLFTQLPQTSVAIVYQHRPRRRWTELFAELSQNLTYAHTAIAVHEATLAFVALAGNAVVGKLITTALEKYVAQHPLVTMTSLVCREGQS
jgi:hypothetical protein